MRHVTNSREETWIMLKNIMRFIAMHAPFQQLRIAMYREAGIKIGKTSLFGGHVWIDVFHP
jgi:hypothetical protein